MQIFTTQEKGNYLILTKQGKTIHSTCNYECHNEVLQALNQYMMYSQKPKKSSKSYEDIIFKYVSELQRKGVARYENHSKCSHYNYYYQNENTAIVADTIVAVFPKHIDKPAYMTCEPRKNYQNIMNLFTYDEHKMEHIKPVLFNNEFYYEIKSYYDILNKDYYVYLNNKQYHFLLSLYDNIENIKKNIICYGNNLIKFTIDNIQVLLVCYQNSSATQLKCTEYNNILNFTKDNYYYTNHSLISPEYFNKMAKPPKAITMLDIKNNLKCFLNFKKIKQYNINYDFLNTKCADV